MRPDNTYLCTSAMRISLRTDRKRNSLTTIDFLLLLVPWTLIDLIIWHYLASRQPNQSGPTSVTNNASPQGVAAWLLPSPFSTYYVRAINARFPRLHHSFSSRLSMFQLSSTRVWSATTCARRLTLPTQAFKMSPRVQSDTLA